jgi:hypothetical protein
MKEFRWLNAKFEKWKLNKRTQQQSVNMSTITLPKGGTIRTFEQPPKGFDPLKADDRLLAVHGFPRRPTDPKPAARWEKILSRPIKLIEPRFREMSHKRRRLPEISSRGVHGIETTDIWSGAVVAVPSGDTFA